MSQLHLFEIPNPCRGVCQTSERGYCVGCYRKREERFQWQQLDDSQKLHVLKLCEQRRKRAQKKVIPTKQEPPTQPENTSLF